MIPRIDDLLWEWGNWAHSFGGPGGGGSVIMSYREPMPCATGGDPDNEKAEQVDRLLAQMPSYLRKHRQAVIRKYLYQWPESASCKDMGIGKTAFKEHIKMAHYWLDGHLFKQDLMFHKM